MNIFLISDTCSQKEMDAIQLAFSTKYPTISIQSHPLQQNHQIVEIDNEAIYHTALKNLESVLSDEKLTISSNFIISMQSGLWFNRMKNTFEESSVVILYDKNRKCSYHARTESLPVPQSSLNKTLQENYSKRWEVFYAEEWDCEIEDPHIELVGESRVSFLRKALQSILFNY